MYEQYDHQNVTTATGTGQTRRPASAGHYAWIAENRTPSYTGSDIGLPRPYSSSTFSGEVSTQRTSDAGLLSGKSRCDMATSELENTGASENKRQAFSWPFIAILTLCIYCTAMSAIFLAVAMLEVRYGRLINKNGYFTISGATVITTALAKTIELSMITVSLAFLGQILARRARSNEKKGGVSLAEMSMRYWILQPGTMFSQWAATRYAAMTTLGIFALLATVASLFYVTAANALVQPQLRFSKWEPRLMQSLVKTSFANPQYIKLECENVMSLQLSDLQEDRDSSFNLDQVSCLQLQFAARASHDVFAYLSTWDHLDANHSTSNATSELKFRPKVHVKPSDNLTVIASWLKEESSNMTKLMEDHGHIIVNVSLALPHNAVSSAAMAPINNLLQADDLDGLGIYRIKASVPSPVVNILCATLSQDDLWPVVESLWDQPAVNGRIRSAPNISDPYLGGTPLDDIYRWGERYGHFNWPPLFRDLPKEHEILTNDTRGLFYGRSSVYLLGSSSARLPSGDLAYPLCQMQAFTTPFCTTLFNASSAGAFLEADCEHSPESLHYIESLPNATYGNATLSREWPGLAGDMFRGLSLGNSNGTASTLGVLLNRLVPVTALLDPSMPSISEVLAVIAGYNLLQATKDAPMVAFFNYTTAASGILDVGQYQYFKASVQAQQYASGGTAPYQKGFLVILFAAVVLNALMLSYLLTHRDWYDDVSEPSTLFGLAINSPPSEEFADNHGKPPHGKQFRSSWKLRDAGDGVYMEKVDKTSGMDGPGLESRRRFGKAHQGIDILMGPIKKVGGNLSASRRLSN